MSCYSGLIGEYDVEQRRQKRLAVLKRFHSRYLKSYAGGVHGDVHGTGVWWAANFKNHFHLVDEYFRNHTVPISFTSPFSNYFETLLRHSYSWGFALLDNRNGNILWSAPDSSAINCTTANPQNDFPTEELVEREIFIWNLPHLLLEEEEIKSVFAFSMSTELLH